jgi:hypothetical protein
VKFIIKFSRGVPPTLCTWGRTLSTLGEIFFVRQATSFTYYLTYTRELGDIKELDQGVSRAVFLA